MNSASRGRRSRRGTADSCLLRSSPTISDVRTITAPGRERRDRGLGGRLGGAVRVRPASAARRPRRTRRRPACTASDERCTSRAPASPPPRRRDAAPVAVTAQSPYTYAVLTTAAAAPGRPPRAPRRRPGRRAAPTSRRPSCRARGRTCRPPAPPPRPPAGRSRRRGNRWPRRRAASRSDGLDRRRHARGAGRRPPASGLRVDAGLQRCCAVIGVGAPVSGSKPPRVFGNAMTSRIESAPASSMQIRSQPKRDAAVRRRAVLERLEQEAELVLRLLRGDAEQVEDPALHVGRGGYGSSRRRSRCRCRRCRTRRRAPRPAPPRSGPSTRRSAR